VLLCRCIRPPLERCRSHNRPIPFLSQSELCTDAQKFPRIHWIDRLQQLGFSLTEIRDFLCDLNAIDTGPLAMEKLRRFYTDKLEDARESIAQYKALAKELQESLVYLAVCEGCGASTPRSACGTCEENEHEYIAAPTLVAAVNESA